MAIGQEQGQFWYIGVWWSTCPTNANWEGMSLVSWIRGICQCSYTWRWYIFIMNRSIKFVDGIKSSCMSMLGWSMYAKCVRPDNAQRLFNKVSPWNGVTNICGSILM